MKPQTELRSSTRICLKEMIVIFTFYDLNSF